MNAKFLKFLQLFESFVNIDYINNKQLVAKNIKAFMDLDFVSAVDVWDYLASSRESNMISDTRFATMIGSDLFQLFFERAATKCQKAVLDNNNIRKAVYQYSPTACSGHSFNILVDLLVANKVVPAEEVLKCIQKNEHIQYGATMQKVLEQLFLELLKKNPAKIEVNKKLNALLSTYIRKIKTDERAMLEQRLRETQY